MRLSLQWNLASGGATDLSSCSSLGADGRQAAMIITKPYSAYCTEYKHNRVRVERSEMTRSDSWEDWTCIDALKTVTTLFFRATLAYCKDSTRAGIKNVSLF